MWGGGFTETVRFLWEKHRHYSHETYWLPKPHSQGALCLWRTRTCWTSWALGRPGWSNLCPVTGTSTLGPAALRSTRASIWKCPLLCSWKSFPMQLLKQVHLSDETRSQPMSNSSKTRRLSVTWQLSGVHHGDMTNDTITFRCMISSWRQEMICIIQFSIRCKKNMKGYWLGAQQGREEAVQPATAVSRWRCAESGLHILGGPGHTNNHDPLFWRTFAVLKQ